MDRIPLLIDTDPGVDDALALLMALRSPAHAVVALTIAAGNVGLHHTVRNALSLLDLLDRDVPVHAGCDRPLLHPSVDAAFVHGQDGFGDAGLPAPTRRPAPEHAVAAMIAASHRHAGKLTMVMLGPLTNLALALRLDPTLPQRVPRLLVMGGAVTGHGNITASAEFNVAFDPEAAHIVFASWPQCELVDWEATLAHPLPFADMEAWMAHGRIGRFYERISRVSRAFSANLRGDWHSADGLAMAVALQPGLVRELDPRPLQVELEGRHYRGATQVDWERRSGRPDNVRIVRAVDLAGYRALVQAALRD
jgi:purine nucleosidase